RDGEYRCRDDECPECEIPHSHQLFAFVPLVRPSHSTSFSRSSSAICAPRSRMSTMTTRHASELLRAWLTRSAPWHRVHARWTSASPSVSLRYVVISGGTYVRGNGFVFGPNRTV